MNADLKAYMPMRSKFNELMNTPDFLNMRLSDEQKKVAEMLFYAGAASAYNVLINEPLMHEAVFDELLDHADQMAREKVA